MPYHLATPASCLNCKSTWKILQGYKGKNMIYTLTLNPALDLELTVAEIRLGHIHRAKTEKIDFGGKGFNVSRVLNVLGVPNIAFGFIAGFTGMRLELELKSAGITNNLQRINGETRTNISIVGGDAGNYIKINQAGAAISSEDVHVMLEKMGRVTHAGDLWVLSGSLPPGAPVDIYSQVIAVIRLAGGQVILDTSGPALSKACRAGVRLLKPNAEEAEELTHLPVRTVPEAWKAAQWIRDLDVETVVISMGGQGALALDDAGCYVVKPPAIELRNPVGAGDALVAGLAAGLSQGKTLVDALRLGAACGASAVAQPGTGVGTRAEIYELMEGVMAQKL